MSQNQTRMILTSFKTFRLPEVIASQAAWLRVTSLSQCNEILAWLRGEEADTMEVANVIQYLPNRYEFELKECEMLRVNCTDGGSITHPRASLRHRFQLIDDYLSDFPEEKSVDLPFPSSQVSPAIHVGDLRECWECLCYLNPRSTLHYLEYNTAGASPSFFSELSEKLTDSERADILQARRLRRYSYPLPREGMGIGVMAYVFHVHDDWTSLLHFFSDCPSYLTFAASSDQERNQIILSGDYYNEDEYWNDASHDVLLSLANFMKVAFVTIYNKEGLGVTKKRLLASFGVRHRYLENLEAKAALPYHISDDWFLERILSDEDYVAILIESIVGKDRIEEVIRDLKRQDRDQVHVHLE